MRAALQAILFGGVSRPTLDLDFLNPVLDPRITLTRTTPATFTGSDGLIQTAASGVPRFEYDPVTLAIRGLLIEEARTNLVRNGSASGASAPATLPTDWEYGTSGSLSGTSVTVVGAGSEGDLGYVDLRFQGTITGSGASIFIRTNAFGDGIVSVAASTAHTSSSFVKMVGGSNANILANNILVQGYLADAVTFVENYISPAIVIPNSGSLCAARHSHSFTTGATVARVLNNCMRVYFQPSGTYDFTLRIGGVQIEAGSFATSYIPTAGAAAPRAGDSQVMPVSSFYSTGPGTLLCEFSRNGFSSGGHPTYMGLGPSLIGFQNGFGTPTQQRFDIVNTGAPQAQLARAGAATAGTIYKQAGAWAANDFAHVSNAATPATASLGTVPDLTGATMVIAEARMNGYIRRIRYWPKRLPNDVLQRLTA